MRFGIFVHEPDGDMGEGQIIGPFLNVDSAHEKAERIMRRYDRLEAIVLPVHPSSTGIKFIGEYARRFC